MKKLSKMIIVALGLAFLASSIASAKVNLPMVSPTPPAKVSLPM